MVDRWWSPNTTTIMKNCKTRKTYEAGIDWKSIKERYIMPAPCPKWKTQEFPHDRKVYEGSTASKVKKSDLNT